MSSALFVELEADFHARVPVVICKEKKRWVSPAVAQLLGYLHVKFLNQTPMISRNSEVMIFEIFRLLVIKTLCNLHVKKKKIQLLISGLHYHMYKTSKPRMKTETYFSQQWPDLQSECRE